MRLTSHRGALLALVALACGVACQALKPHPPPARPAERADVANVARGDRAFALELFGALRSRSGNFAFSPASVRMVLTMAWAGSAGQTAGELGEELGLAGDPTAIHQSNQTLLGAWTKPNAGAASFRLRLAQGFFAQVERQAAQSFIELLQRHYAAPFSPKDFAAPEVAREQINHWVDKRTEGRIEEMLPPGSLDSGLELVLVSAVDFQAPWKEPFRLDHTAPGKFERPGAKPVSAALMTRVGTHGVNETPEAQLVELELGGGDYVFDLIVPKGELAAFEATLDERKLDALLSGVAPKRSTVTLPRFVAGETEDLAAAVQKTGVHAAFTPGKADFSPITGTTKLHLSRLLHRVSLRVDEGASAEGSGKGKAPEAEGVAVRATRPFLYLVRDARRNMILCFGRLSEPPPP